MTLSEKKKLEQYYADKKVNSTPEAYIDNRTDAEKSVEGWQAGGYSVANSVLMGLPDFLLKNVGSGDAYKELKELRERNSKATLAGDVAGTIGSMFIPGGALVKGAGMGAKAVGAVRTGDKLLDAARLIKTGTKVGKLGKVGTGIVKGAGQAAEQGIARGLTGLDFTSTDALANSAIEGGRNALTATALGGGIGGAMGGVSKVMGGRTSDFLRKYSDEAGDKAEDILFKKVGFNRESIEKAARLGEEAAGDMAQGARTVSSEVLENRVINELAPKLKTQGYDLLNKLKITNKVDYKNIFKGKSADEITNIITKAMPELQGSDLNKVQHMIATVGKELVGDVTGGNIGSVEKLVKNPMVLASIIGGGTGGVSSIISGEFDGADIAQKAAMGAAGGLLISKSPAILAKMLKSGSKIGLKAADALDSVPTAGIARLVNQGLMEAPKAAAIIKLQADRNENPGATVDEKLNTMDPAKVEQATIEFSDQFKGVMDNKLNDIYENYYSDMTPKDFMTAVAGKTNNFQSMPGMASILYMGDEKGQDNFLRKYDTYLALKDLDFDQAIEKEGFFDFVSPGSKSKKEARNTLVQALANMDTAGDISKRPAAIKRIEKDIQQIQNQPELIGQFMDTYGLGFKELEALGLVS